MVEVAAQDLGRLDGREVDGVVDATRVRPSGATQPARRRAARRRAPLRAARVAAPRSHLRRLADGRGDPATAPCAHRASTRRREARGTLRDARLQAIERSRPCPPNASASCGPTTSGLPRGKYVPAHLADHGVRHCKGTWALGFDREMTPYTHGLGLGARPARHGGALRGRRHPPGLGGGHARRRRGPHARRRARRGLAARGAAQGGRRLGGQGACTTYAGIELEAYLLEPDGEGGFRPIDTPGAFVYGTGTAVDPHGVIDDIWRAAEVSELALESVNSEYDNGQFELTLRYADALRAADDAFLFKVLAREVAAKRGYLLTFLGRPFADRGGSGLHLNLSWMRRVRRQRRQRRRDRRRPERARDARDRRADGAPPRARRAVRSDGQRVQAPEARPALGVLAQLGLRPPRRDGARLAPSAAPARGSSTASATARHPSTSRWPRCCRRRCSASSTRRTRAPPRAATGST